MAEKQPKFACQADLPIIKVKPCSVLLDGGVVSAYFSRQRAIKTEHVKKRRAVIGGGDCTQALIGCGDSVVIKQEEGGSPPHTSWPQLQVEVKAEPPCDFTLQVDDFAMKFEEGPQQLHDESGPDVTLTSDLEVSSRRRPYSPEPFRGMVVGSSLPISANVCPRVEDDTNFSANMNSECRELASESVIPVLNPMSCDEINSKRRKISDNSESVYSTPLSKMTIKSVDKINASVETPKFLSDLRVLYKCDNNVINLKKSKKKYVSRKKVWTHKKSKLKQQPITRAKKNLKAFKRKSKAAPISISQIKIKIEPTESEITSLEPTKNENTINPFETVYLPSKSQNPCPLKPFETVYLPKESSNTVTAFETVYLPTKPASSSNISPSPKDSENIHDMRLDSVKNKHGPIENKNGVENPQPNSESECEVIDSTVARKDSLDLTAERKDSSDSTVPELEDTDVDVHVTSVSDDELSGFYQCPYCTHDFKTAENLCTHLYLDKKLDINNYCFMVKRENKCMRCNRKFASKVLLEKHLLTHEITCDICKKYFKYDCNLRQHQLESKHDYNILKCYHCNKKFCNVIHISEHANICHDRKITYQCQECGMKFYHIFRLLEHCRGTKKKLKLLNTENVYKHLYTSFSPCKILQNDYLYGFIKIGTIIKNSMISCWECKNYFSNLQYLDQHFTSVHRDKILEQRRSIDFNLFDNLKDIEKYSKLLENASEIQSENLKQNTENPCNELLVNTIPKQAVEKNEPSANTNMIKIPIEVNTLENTKELITEPVKETIVAETSTNQIDLDITNKTSESVLKIIKHNPKKTNNKQVTSSSKNVIQIKKIPLQLNHIESSSETINNKSDWNDKSQTISKTKSLTIKNCPTSKGVDINDYSSHGPAIEFVDIEKLEKIVKQMSSTQKNVANNSASNSSDLSSDVSIEEIPSDHYALVKFDCKNYFRGKLKRPANDKRHNFGMVKYPGTKQILATSDESSKNTKIKSNVTEPTSHPKIRVVMESPQINAVPVSYNSITMIEEPKNESVIKIIHQKETNIKPIPCKTKKLIGIKKIPLQLNDASKSQNSKSSNIIDNEFLITDSNTNDSVVSMPLSSSESSQTAWE